MLKTRVRNSYIHVCTVYMYMPVYIHVHIHVISCRIALTRGKIRLVTLGTEIGARTTHGMWNCAEIIMIAK